MDQTDLTGSALYLQRLTTKNARAMRALLFSRVGTSNEPQFRPHRWFDYLVVFTPPTALTRAGLQFLEL